MGDAFLGSGTLEDNTSSERHPALSLTDVNLELYLSRETNIGQTSFIEDMGNGKVQVQCTTIDDLVYNDNVPPPTAIKLDVEGWEENVLLGAKHLFQTQPPRMIVFEAACDGEEKLINKSLEVLLKVNGYEISLIPRPSGKMYKTRQENYYVENFLAIRK